jgi:hypothetical protein
VLLTRSYANREANPGRPYTQRRQYSSDEASAFHLDAFHFWYSMRSATETWSNGTRCNESRHLPTRLSAQRTIQSGTQDG